MIAKSARLLVVDDNEDNRYTLSARLAREGYADIVSAGNGREALELMHTGGFDLVLLDIMMPEMNGYQVLEAMRADPRLRFLPVIVISAGDQTDGAIRCIELGAEDFLPKPFNPTLLRARVGAMLEKKRMRDEIAQHIERLERDLKFARAVQLSMVPQDLPAAGPDAPVEIHGALVPARAIGGDLYDFFWLAPDRLCLVVADVSDKGVSAALFMARAKTAIRLLAQGTGGTQSPPEGIVRLFERLNDELCRENPHSLFVALLLCVLDVRTGALAWCNAAHPPPLIVKPDGVVERLAAESTLPLGLQSPLSAIVSAAQLQPGTCIVLYTDGITEAMDAQGALYGEARLRDVLAGAVSLGAHAMLSELLDQVRTFAGDAEPADDIAAIVCRWRP